PRTPLRSLASDEKETLFAGRVDQLTFHGPTPNVRIVGVVRTRLDLGIVSYAKRYFVASPAFYEKYGAQIADFTPQLDIRLNDSGGAGRFIGTARDTVQKDLPVSADERGFNARVVGEGIVSIRNASRVQ